MEIAGRVLAIPLRRGCGGLKQIKSPAWGRAGEVTYAATATGSAAGAGVVHGELLILGCRASGNAVFAATLKSTGGAEAKVGHRHM